MAKSKAPIPQPPLTVSGPGSRGADVPFDPRLPARLQHVSPSQIKQARECLRKWAYQKLWQTSVPGTEAQALGTNSHAVLERWAREGDRIFTYPGEEYHELVNGVKARVLPWRVAAQATPHLPKWGPDLLPEVNLVHPKNGLPSIPFVAGEARIPFIGFIDLLKPPRNGVARVTDYKTTKSLYWADSALTLRSNPQVIGYSKWVQTVYAVRESEAEFLYLTTAKPFGARSVAIKLSTVDVSKGWAKINRETDRMLDVALRAPTADSDPKGEIATRERSQCNAFGGCAHRARCLGAVDRESGASQFFASVNSLVKKKKVQ